MCKNKAQQKWTGNKARQLVNIIWAFTAYFQKLESNVSIDAHNLSVMDRNTTNSVAPPLGIAYKELETRCEVLLSNKLQKCTFGMFIGRGTCNDILHTHNNTTAKTSDIVPYSCDIYIRK